MSKKFYGKVGFGGCGYFRFEWICFLFVWLFVCELGVGGVFEFFGMQSNGKNRYKRILVNIDPLWMKIICIDGFEGFGGRWQGPRVGRP
jgi:hypothetical protein